MDPRKLVEYKLGEEADRAKAISAKLRIEGKIGSALQKEDIRLFHPTLHRHGPVQTTNLPSDVTLRQYLLFGESTVFNLKPVSPVQFEREFGLTIRAVEELAEQRLVIPVIYVRNPESWREAQHLEGIIRESCETGVSLDTYMALRDSNYFAKVREHEQFLRKIFDSSSPEKQVALVGKARVFEHSGFVRGLARRWSYVDVLEPSEAVEIERRFTKPDLDDALEYLYATKTIVAADITEAYGGRFVWGRSDSSICEARQAGLTAVTSGTLANNIRVDPSHLIHFPQALEYALASLTETEPFEPLDHIEADHLMKFIRNDGNRRIRDELLSTIDRLVVAGIEDRGIFLDATIADYRRLVRDYRSRLKWMTRTIGAASAGGGSAIGGVIGGVHGAVLGALIWYFIADKTDQSIAQALARFGKRTQRAFVELDRLRQQKQENESTG